MALPTQGQISTDDIMGPNGLNIGVQTKVWYNGSNGLWDLAVAGSTPKNKAIAGGPFVLPDDWWGYPPNPAYVCNLSGTTEITVYPVPLAPFTLTAGSATTSSNSFSWDLAPNASTSAIGYRVYRNSSLIATVSKATNSYLDSGLSPNTQYTYYIQAYTNSSNIQNSNSILMTTTSATLFLLPYAQTTNCDLRNTGNPTWNTARSIANESQNPVNSQAITNLISGNYAVIRSFFGVNCAAVTAASSGGIRVSKLTTSPHDNAYAVIAICPGGLPANYIWTLADFPKALTATICSNVTLIPGSPSGSDIFFEFTAAGLNYINSNTQCTFVMMEYDHDYLNVPATNANQGWTSVNSSSRLYYYQ